MEPINDLTLQQWGLAQFFEDVFSEDPRTVITKEMICNNFPEDYGRRYEFSSDHNSSAYRRIRRDIKAIKKSKGFKHILITVGNCGWKIATKKEAEEFLEKEKIQALKKLKLCSVINMKIRNNGQYFLNDESVTDIHAQNCIDTFLELA